MNIDLTNKVAILTGAGGAISGAIAEAMAKQGAKVALWDIQKDHAENKAAVLRSQNLDAQAIYCDVTKKKSIDTALEETIKYRCWC